MNTYAEKAKQRQSKAFASNVSDQQRDIEPALQFVDAQSGPAGKGEITEAIDANPRLNLLSAHQKIANKSPQIARLGVIDAMTNKKKSQATQLKQDLQSKASHINFKTVQRLAWSERHTGVRENIALTDKQQPEGVQRVEGDGASLDRKVYSSQEDKGRSGFFWHKQRTREVSYDIKSMQQYEVVNPDTVFYTAVRNSAKKPIGEHGINPNYNNAEKPDGSTQYNVRGFNYFGRDGKIPSLYGGQFLAPDPWTTLTFKLPAGTRMERDPEIPDGLRTAYHIMPGDIISGL